MMAFLLALTLLVATSGAAEAGPVAPVFAAIGSWISGTLAAGGIGAFLLRTAASMALSALAQAMRKKPEQKQTGITTEATTAGGTIPQRLIFGRYCTGGQHVCPPMVYQTDDDPNEWLVYVISLADKPITGISRVIIDGRMRNLAGNPAASLHGDTPGATVQDANYSQLFWMRFHDGNQTAPDAYLRRVFATYPERPWTADMIGHGVAYVVLTFKGKAEDQAWQGFPSIKFEVDGHPLRDPRTGTDVFTRNPAVIAYNILRGIDIPGGDRWGVGATNFVLPHVIAAANICDEAVPVATGGTRLRYQAGLEISVADEPHTALMEFVKAMGGDVADMGGTWLLKAGEAGGAVYSFTDDDIIVSDTRSLRPYPGLNELVNAIHGQYPDPAQQWESKEAVPIYSPAYEAEDGGRRLIAEIDFPAVPYPMQVRALMREMLADHRKHRTHIITLPPDALGVNLGEMVGWTSDINGYIAKLFKVVAKRVDPQSLCAAFTLTEHDPSDYDYDPDSDGVLPVVPSPDPVVPVIVGVDGFAVTAVVVPGDNGSRPGIRMVWNPEIDARSVFWEIYRVSGNTLVASGIERPAAGEKVVTEGLVRATAYAVRGQLVIPGRVTEPTSWIYVTTEDIRLGWPDLTDDVLADINQLETWINGTGGLLRDAMDAIALLGDQATEGDADAFNARQVIRADLDVVSLETATAIDALIVRTEQTEAGLVSNADAITLVSAKSDRASANGLFRVSAEATPTGAESRIGLRAEATADGTSHSAAMYLEAKTDGTSQAGFVADRFWIASDHDPDATRTVPFIVEDGVVHLDNAYIGNVIQSYDFVTGPTGTGWRIDREGVAEFNNVIIRRQIQKASGTVNIGSFTPQSMIANEIVLPSGTSGGPPELRYPTGADVNIANGPGLVVSILSTPIPITEWQGTTKTYIATAGMTGTVLSPQAPDAYWGWTADVLPLTRWDGNQTLRLKLSFWSRGVSSVQNCVVTFRIYEVS